MANYASQKSKRFKMVGSIKSPDYIENPHGRHFKVGKSMIDLTSVVVLASTVDTVRQLYTGGLKPHLLEEIERKSKDPSALIKIMGYQFYVRRMGMRSGYAYRLQNNELGMTVLVKSHYRKDDKEGSHLKIEISPHHVLENGIGRTQSNMDKIAVELMTGFQRSGIAVHLAVDVQGWEAEKDFLDRLQTRSRIIRRFDGLSEVKYENLSNIAATYGNPESFMVGKANSLQLAVYRKDIEIQRHDKVDYFHDLWKKNVGDAFKEDEPVWRIEVRFHHLALREFGNGTEDVMAMTSIKSISPYLTDLWQFALTRHKLNVSKRKIDPFWQLIQEDCEFNLPASGIELKRAKKLDTSAIVRNIAGALGNLVTIGARANMQTQEFYFMLRDMPLWREFSEYFKERGMDEFDQYQHFETALMQRRMLRNAA